VKVLKDLANIIIKSKIILEISKPIVRIVC